MHVEAFGEAQEHALLLPMIVATRENFQVIGKNDDVFHRAALAADSGFHTNENIKALFEQNIDAYVADNQFRKRDPRFATAEQYRARHKEEIRKSKAASIARKISSTTLPARPVSAAGKRLYQNGSSCWLKGYEFVKFTGPKMHCVPCTQRDKCLRHPERTPTRSVVFFKDRSTTPQQTYTTKMKQKIDTPEGRQQYSRRLGIVEPVFAHIAHHIGLNRFSLRGRIKVNIQWKLYCIVLVHNLTKIHRYGFS